MLRVWSRPMNGRHHAEPELRRGRDHLLDVIDINGRFLLVGDERIGVVAQRRHRDAVARGLGLHRRRLGVIERRDVEVGDAGVAALAPCRPASTSPRRTEAVLAGELKNAVEIEIRKDRGDETEASWHLETSPTRVRVRLRVRLSLLRQVSNINRSTACEVDESGSESESRIRIRL